MPCHDCKHWIRPCAPPKGAAAGSVWGKCAEAQTALKGEPHETKAIVQMAGAGSGGQIDAWLATDQMFTCRRWLNKEPDTG